MKKRENYIWDYLMAHYPDEQNLIVRGYNCILRKYEDELERDENSKYREVLTKSFFRFLQKHSDEELIKIRNLGRGTLKFLRKAQKDYESENHIYATRFNYVCDDWIRVKNHCRTTDNKHFTEKEPTEEFKKKLLISEHSPIRLIEIDWTWEDIYSWVATHWSRHKFEKFISTQRDDRKEHDIPRGKMPQDTPVNFDGYANMQSLIDSFRKRLCFMASPETRELAEDFKMALHETKPELADVITPNCVYRCACPEFKTCGYFNKFLEYAYAWYNEAGVIGVLTDIQARYDLYNEMFYESKGIKDDTHD